MDAPSRHHVILSAAEREQLLICAELGLALLRRDGFGLKLILDLDGAVLDAAADRVFRAHGAVRP